MLTHDDSFSFFFFFFSLWTGTSQLHSQALYSIHRLTIPEVLVLSSSIGVLIMIFLSFDMGFRSLQILEGCCLMRLFIAMKSDGFVFFRLIATHSQLLWCKVHMVCFIFILTMALFFLTFACLLIFLVPNFGLLIWGLKVYYLEDLLGHPLSCNCLNWQVTKGFQL